MSRWEAFWAAIGMVTGFGLFIAAIETRSGLLMVGCVAVPLACVWLAENGRMLTARRSSRTASSAPPQIR